MLATAPAAARALPAVAPRLVVAEDRDFAWMLGEGPRRSAKGLRLPDGGVDEPVILDIIRGMAAEVRAVHDRGSWMIAAGAELVGLCCYKHPPYRNGEVEIGYGIAEAHRCRGYATRAVAMLAEQAAADPAVSRLVAATAIGNHASRRVLERNRFHQKGTRSDAEDGPLLLWSRSVVGEG